MVGNMKNKNGWIRIVEAIVAVLLIMGFFAITFGNNTNDFSPDSEDYASGKHILSEIQLDGNFRNYILGVSLPEDFEDFDSSLKTHLEDRFPENLNCSSKICSLTDNCEYDSEIENVYVNSVVIAANSTLYSPRQIKLFCWEV